MAKINWHKARANAKAKQDAVDRQTTQRINSIVAHAKRKARSSRATNTNPRARGSNPRAIATGKLVRVVAPHFVAGLIISQHSRRCCKAAPILAWTLGKHEDELRTSFRDKAWKATIVRDFT